MVCSVDHLASSAGVGVLRDGGNAVDAAIATSAVLAVTWQHACGIGGDLFALVHDGKVGPPLCLNAAGRAGGGANAEELRAEGHAVMPFQGDVRTATVPGCIDGWLTLHERGGSLPLERILADAIALATDGFPASITLAASVSAIVSAPGSDDYHHVRRAGDWVTRPRIAAHLRAIVAGGRAAFYEASFGDALLEVGGGWFADADLARSQADWVDPLGLRVWDHDVWTVPPTSQGYLSLAGARIAELVGVPTDDASGEWAHVLVEAARLAGYDRIDALFDGADGDALIADTRLEERAARFDPDRRSDLRDSYAGGGTIHLATADRHGGAVSLIQSNAQGWGCGVIADGVFLHNRGNGFNLQPGHPAELAPGKRPPHTLSPASVTTPDGSLRSVLGTMGGDSQPQIVLQLLTRLLHHGQAPGAVISAPRWVLGGGPNGFSLWTGDGPSHVLVEERAPAGWTEGLYGRGHRVETVPDFSGGFGHAHLIEVNPAGGWRGASDPGPLTGSASGH